MNYKPDEATLISYHYGELEGEELKKVEEYLLRHPDERKRLAEWKDSRSIMSGLRDKEVIAPPIFFGDNQRSIWRETYVRMSIGIAASLLVVMVAARLMGLSATYKTGELRIAFGSQPVVEAPTLNEDKVASMIQASLEENNNALQAGWDEDREKLESSIRDNINSSSKRIDMLVRQASAGQQAQVKDFVSQLQADNLKLMKDYLQLSSKGQKEYVETLLVDFSKYLQEQRKQDLQYVQSSMTNLKENSDQFKKETEQILTTLITAANTTRTDSQKSY